MTVTQEETTEIREMFESGVHYAYSKSRRHPTASEYIYGRKENIEIFDLEKTAELLAKAEEFVKKLASEGKTILFVSSKYEAGRIVKEGAESAGQPYVIGRWIGGTLTNFSQIRKRVEKLHDLLRSRETGALEKYTKRERLMIDRDIKRLDEKFGGIMDMERRPDALFVVDPRDEDTAINEAHRMNIPVIALCNSDCDFSVARYPIAGNDVSRSSIEYVVKRIASAYTEGKK